MCGRFAFTRNKKDIQKRFDLKKVPDQIPFSFNIAPSQEVPVILNESPDELTFVRWGLIPHWAKEKINISPINAKAETITEKPMFKDLFKSKRCLVLADAFYEWQKVGGGKNPFSDFTEI